MASGMVHAEIDGIDRGFLFGNTGLPLLDFTRGERTGGMPDDPGRALDPKGRVSITHI